MKKVFFLVCFIIFAMYVLVNALALEDIDDVSQVLKLESSNLEYNLGSVEKNKITKKVILIINKLNQAIEVTDARSTCECIKIKTLPQIVARNGIFKVEITFDSTGISQDIEEMAYIITKNMKYELIRLEISVTITE